MAKALLLLCLLLIPTSVLADRTILTPSGYAMTEGYDGEVIHTVSGKARTIAFVDAGTQWAQLQASYAERQGTSRLAISLQSTIIPETFTLPAVSFGIDDVANSTGAFSSDGFYGRTFYLAMTKSLDNGLQPPNIHGLVFTGGVGAGAYHGLFGGVSVNLPIGFVGTAEYDSRTMNYRIALPLFSSGRLSYNRIGNSNWIGLDLHSAISL
jgi:hypothetical protein